MDLTGETDAVCARKIIKQREINEALKPESKFICIFEAPAQALDGPFQLTVMEIDVLMAAGRQGLADDTMEQIAALCCPESGFAVNGRPVDRVTMVGGLACAAGYYRCGVRVAYYSSTAAAPKTL